jgi:hypothetical protein
MALAREFPAQFSEYNFMYHWISMWYEPVARCGEAWDVGARVLLFGMAAAFWGLINLALRQVETGFGICHEANRMRLGEIERRSTWGRLVAEANGEAGPGWGIESDSQEHSPPRTAPP